MLKYTTLILFCFLFGYCKGQTPNTIFKPIALDQGHINDIMRDSEGFIWISTQDGLTKYNGTHFIQFNYNRKDTNSLAHNYVWKTFEDTRHNIWIGLFGGGLCRYDRTQNRFYRYDNFGSIANHGIRIFDQLDDSTLIVGTDYGLFLYDLNSFSFDPDTSFQENQFEKGLFHTHSMEVIGSDIVVAGENGGYIISSTSKEVVKIDPTELGVRKLQFIKKITEKEYFIAGQDIFLKATFDTANRNFKVINRIKSIESITVNDLSMDASGLILLVAEEGLFKLDFDNKSIDPIPSDQPEINNLEDKVAYCIEEIEPNLKWIGTKTNIYEFSQHKKPFQHINIDQLCGSAILGMDEDNDGNLWVATRRGLGRIKNFDKAKTEWEYLCYDYKTNPEMRSDYILNIKVIEDLIMVGYRKKGFSLLEVNSNNSVVFQNPPAEVDELTKTGSASNFYLDSNKQIWISTSGNGVVKWNYHKPTEVYQYINVDGQNNVLTHNYNFGFEEIDDQWIAAATAAGISIINKETDSTYHIVSGSDSLSLSGNFIMDFHRDAKNQLWVCTDGGINLWHDDNTFTSWTKNEGLPNDIIYGMLEVEDQLWVSSNKGLTQIQNIASPEFKTYSKEDDILNDEHNQFSFYKSKSNELFFGGKLGITFFDPKDIQQNDVQSIPVIESFLLFNKSGDSKLTNHINYTDKLTLDHNENFLSFDLAALSYFKSDQNQYRYRLSPLHDEWINMSKRNFFSLNGLASGQYNLSIQSSNNDGFWGQRVKSIDILIKRPLYLRWYAWLLYALILASIIYAIYKTKVDHITSLSKAREDERMKIRERSARDFHDEVGSLITKLSLLNQYLLTDTPKESKESIGILNKMQSNIQRIRTGMKDFIWVLDPNKDSLASAIIKIKEIGNDLFEHTGTRFQCNTGNEVQKNIDLNGVQRRQLILSMKEAFHNIVKHADAKTCIVQISQSNAVLYFSINDDGKGFDLDSYSAGYGLRSIKERARKMNGTIKISSTKNEGTQITLIIPTYPNGL